MASNVSLPEEHEESLNRRTYQMNTSNRTIVLTVAVALVAAFIYPASADQALTHKWFPGHYLTSSPDRNGIAPAISQSAINMVGGNPNFVGYKTLYLWGKHESRPGVYDFSKILADLDYAQGVGKKIVLVIRERQFDCALDFPLPEYMRDPSSVYQGGVYTQIGGSSTDPDVCRRYPKLWIPEVANAFSAFWTALGAQIDSHPALALVQLQESAMVDLAKQEGWNQPAFLNNIINIHSAISAAFPTTPFTPYLNYLSGLGGNDAQRAASQEAIIANLVGKKGGMGDPDLVIDGGSGSPLTKPYGEYWRTYRGIVTFAVDHQATSYQWLSAREVYDRGVDGLGVHFMAWQPITLKTHPNSAYSIHDVIDVINAENGRINTAPPSNLFASEVPISPPENLIVISD